LSRPAEAATWGAAKYGLDQLLWTWIRDADGSSMWETVTANVLFCVSGPCAMIVSVRFVARLE
jgi:hypothetical protein